MRYPFLLFILLLSINAFCQTEEVEFSCMGKKYSIQLDNIESDSIIGGFHGYFRDIRFEDLKGVLSINCQTDTRPSYCQGEGYIHLYDSADVRIGISSVDTTYHWREMTLSEDLAINYICKSEDIHKLNKALLSLKRPEEPKPKLHGIATDGKGNPILACDVIVKGTTIATITNECGEFTLPFESDELTLIFNGMSYVDLRVFEVSLELSEIEGKQVVFQLGKYEQENENCDKVDKKLKKYKIK